MNSLLIFHKAVGLVPIAIVSKQEASHRIVCYENKTQISLLFCTGSDVLNAVSPSTKSRGLLPDGLESELRSSQRKLTFPIVFRFRNNVSH